MNSYPTIRRRLALSGSIHLTTTLLYLFFRAIRPLTTLIRELVANQADLCLGSIENASFGVPCLAGVVGILIPTIRQVRL